jgi:hypothetical protein
MDSNDYLVFLAAAVVAGVLIARYAAAATLPASHPVRRFFDRLDGTRNVTRTWSGYEPAESRNPQSGPASR